MYRLSTVLYKIFDKFCIYFCFVPYETFLRFCSIYKERIFCCSLRIIIKIHFEGIKKSAEKRDRCRLNNRHKKFNKVLVKYFEKC